MIEIGLPRVVFHVCFLEGKFFASHGTLPCTMLTKSTYKINVHISPASILHLQQSYLKQITGQETQTDRQTDVYVQGTLNKEP